MIAWLRRLLQPEPRLSRATGDDSAGFAVIHAESFRAGWSEEEFARLLMDRNVLADRATTAKGIVGFILSRLVHDEAEILSVAVAHACRGQGLAGRLLDVHLRRLVEAGAATVFLEVEEGNLAARRLYARRGFKEISRRAGYYGAPNGKRADALVLRATLG